MKTEKPIESIQRAWGVLRHAAIFGALALMPTVLTAAALPPLKQTFFVPFPEADFQNSLKAIGTTGSAVGNSIKSTISIVVPTAGTIIVYDQWEDGYEADPVNPVQASTQIWGDGNPAHGQPPGYPTNILPAGAVIKLQNLVSLPRSATTLAYDGRDRIMASSAIAVTRAAWATAPGTVLCSATEVYDSYKYGTTFKIPVGTNTGSTQLFEYSSLHIMASQDNTSVSVTVDPSVPGTVVTKILQLGESMFVNGGVKAGATVTTTKPVQVQELTGDIGSTYESRTFAIRPTSLWGASYYAPVGTTLASETHNIFLYNPNAAAITVAYETVSGTGSFSVAANGNYQFTMPMNSGAHFYTATGDTFYAVGANDSGGAAGANQVHDWGYALLPENYLTSGIIVPWGPGSDTTGVNTNPDQNGSPVWVTPTANTTVYVNFSGDLTSGTSTAPNGAKYNVSYTAAKWQSLQIYDTTDKDMTGARIFTTDGTRLAAAWGEDPAKAGPGSPYLDLGTTIVPFPQPSILKAVKLYTDVNSNGLVDAGDTVEYTVRVANEGVVDLENTVVLDSLPSSLTYVVGSTKVNGVTVADNALPSTAFPVDETGYTLATIPPGSFTLVTFRATVNAGATSIVNLASTVAGGQTLTSTTTAPVVGATAPLVVFTDAAGATVATYAANGGIYLKVTDAAANTNATTLQTVSVLVKDTSTGDLQTVILTETGINTGIFTNATALATSTTSGTLAQDGTLYALAGDPLTVNYTNSTSGLSASSAAAIAAAATPVKKLYLSDPSQALDRVDPVATSDATTAAIGTSVATISVVGTAASSNAGNVASYAFSYDSGSTGSNRILRHPDPPP